MKNLIEYLILFILFLCFCDNNIFTIGYIASGFLSCVAYLILYFKNRKNINKEKYKFSYDFLILSITILIINLIEPINLGNIVFGYFLNGILIAYIIISLVKKEFDFNKKIYNYKWLFDAYTIVYMLLILVKVISLKV